MSDVDKNAVNVWFLNVGEWVEQRFLHLLSAEEQKQVRAFKFHDDSLRYIASRGLARTVISHLLSEAGYAGSDGVPGQGDGVPGQLGVGDGVPGQGDGALSAGELKFAEGPFGKPSLVGFPDFHYNSSHASGKVVIATANAPVGIDIESTSNCRLINSDLEKVLLSQSQLESLEQIGSADRKREVLRLWVHKEAYLKAIGTGLSISPKEIELAEGADNLKVASSSFQIMTPNQHSGSTSEKGWFSRQLNFDQMKSESGENVESNEFVGAVVFQGADWSVNYFDFVAVMGSMKATC